LKFRKKPVVIEAQQLTVDTFWDIVGLLESKQILHQYRAPQNDRDEFFIKIKTLEGVMNASPDDWIITGVQGECYPCKPDIFEKTYERVEE
jgi:hypothetical protein